MYGFRQFTANLIAAVHRGVLSLEHGVRGSKARPKALVRVLRLEGPIMAGRDRRNISMRSMGPLIRKAFALDFIERHRDATEHKAPEEANKPRRPGVVPRKPDMVCLLINSPGGSPTQSSLLHGAIRRAKEEAGGVPVVAFVEDVAASGGYYLACAADEVFVDENSILGSIGVVSGSLGLERVIERWGVTRRLTTGGKRKAAGDPLSPEDEEATAQRAAIVGHLHGRFKELVRRSRGSRLGAVLRLQDDKLGRVAAEFEEGESKASDGDAAASSSDASSLLREVEVEEGLRVQLMQPRADGTEASRMPRGWGEEQTWKEVGGEAASAAPPVVSKEDDLFQGDVWPGLVAVHLGLADGIGALDDVVRTRLVEQGVVKRRSDVVIETVNQRRGIAGFFDSFGADWAEEAAASATRGAVQSLEAEAAAAAPVRT